MLVTIKIVNVQWAIIDDRIITVTAEIVCQNLHNSKFDGRQNTDCARDVSLGLSIVYQLFAFCYFVNFFC